MSCGRAILCIILPPLAVIDFGCAPFLIVCVLTLAGWLPGALVALILNTQLVQGKSQQTPPKRKAKGKRKRRNDDFDFD